MTSVQALLLPSTSFPLSQKLFAAAAASSASSQSPEFVPETFTPAEAPVTSIASAYEQDSLHSAIYSTFSLTRKVPGSVLDRERLLMMLHWLASGHEAQGMGMGVGKEDYSDEHVEISTTRRTLTVRHWLVAHPVLVVPLKDIVYILPAEQVVPPDGVEDWGVGRTGVGWARDARRLSSSSGHQERPGAWTGHEHCERAEDEKMRAGTVEGEQSYVCKIKCESGHAWAGFTVQRPGEFVQVLEDTWYGD